MTSPEVLHRLLDCLESLEVPYMLVGGVSVNQYTDPRSTNDADVVVDLSPEYWSEIGRQLGPAATVDRQMMFESATGTHRNIIRLADTEFRIELFRLSNDAHDQERFLRRVRGVLDGRAVWVPTAEDVVVWKLRWWQSAGRGKDHDDIRNVVATQFGSLDWPYIHRWCDQHGTRELLDEIITTIPPDLLES